QIRLDVQGVGQGAVYVLPRRLYFYEVYEETSRPVTRLLMLTREGKPFKIVSVKSDSPALGLEPTTNEQGLYGQVVVTYRGGWKAGKIEGKLTLPLADTDWPTVEIPYSGEVRPGKDPGLSPAVLGGATGAPNPAGPGPADPR